MLNKNIKPTNQVEDEKNPYLGDIEPIHPAIVGKLMLESRDDWDQEKYVYAIKSALLVKGLTQWCIGLFTHETLNKWPHLTYKDVAEQLNVKSETLEMYTRVYSYYAKYRPNFTPPNEYSFEFLRVVATASKKFKKDPTKELERLADEGIIDNSKAAYRNIHESTFPKKLQPLPKLVFEWDESKKRILPKIVGKEELLLPFIKCIDWDHIEQQHFEITGKTLDLSKIKKIVKEIDIEVEPTQT
jgi:hypothetical protein